MSIQWKTSHVSMTELGIYLDWQRNPNGTAYNCPILIPLPGGTDMARLRAALRQAVMAHPGILSRFRLEADGTVSRLMPIGALDAFPITIRESIGEPDVEALVRPFSDPEGELYRFEIIRGKDQDYLFTDIHHLVYDATSAMVFFMEADRVYRGEAAEGESLSTPDIAEREWHDRDTEAFARAEAWYARLFSGVEVSSTPIHDRKGSEAKNAYLVRQLDLDAGKIREYIKEAGIRTSTFFSGVYGYLLSRFSGADDALYATIHNGRTPETGNTVGMLVKTLPVLERFEATGSIRDHLVQLDAQILGSRENGLFSFADTVNRFSLDIPTYFAYQGDLEVTVDFLGTQFPLRIIQSDDPKDEIVAELFRSKGTYSLRVSWRTDLFDRESIEQFAASYEKIAQEFLRVQTFGQVDMTSKAQLAALDSFLPLPSPIGASDNVVTLFRSQARKRPEAAALIIRDRQWSYGEIEAASERVAHALNRRGIGRGQVVSILIHRNEYMVIASLGVLKAGACYQPLDPSYPPERLCFMVQDAEAALVIVDADLMPLLNGCNREFLLTGDIPSLPEVPAGEALPAPEPHDMFTLLYTSGTTGVPKGVILEHGNLANFCKWYRGAFNVTEATVHSAYASYGFDANMMDLYPTLTAGGCVCVIPEDLRLDLPEMSRYLEKNNVSVMFMTTQVGRQFVTSPFRPACVRVLTVGGEKLAPMAPPEGVDFHNLYGPSEATILVTEIKVDREYLRIPIGRPAVGAALYVVDQNGHRVPPCVPGELWIAGPGVARGYLNRPEKTAESFTPNPFSAEEGYDRVYHTGDVVRYLPDGVLEFIGRNDDQVKVRGFRIELTEVENVIREFPGIADVTVQAFEIGDTGEKHIAAYIVSHERVDIDALKRFIGERKPPYMIPEVTMQIERIPLTQNQKVDRRALPKPERRTAAVTPPENERQAQMLELAAEVIGYRDIGIDMDLFDAGLTSVGVLRFNMLMSRAFNLALKLSDLNQNPTIRKLDALVSASEEVEQYDLRDDYPITQTQKGIFVEWSMDRRATAYNIPLLLKVDPGLDAARLAEATRAAIDAHPYLKATLFADEDGSIRIRRRDDAEARVFLRRVEKLPDPDALVRPFDLLNEALYRAAVYDTEEGLYLYLEAHHILFDGTSAAILLDDIQRAYRGEALKREAISGFEVALEEEKARKSRHYEEAKAYYDGLLRGCETECLPPKLPNPGGARAEVLERRDRFANAVSVWCEEHRLTPNALFNAAFGFALSRFTPVNDVLYTTVYNGRGDSRLENTVSMLVKTLPVLVRTGEREPVEALVRKTQEQLVDSMANDIFSFAEISSAYGVHADILFVYQGDNFRFDRFCGSPASLVTPDIETVKAPLTVTVERDGDEYLYRVEYRGDLYRRELIESFLDALIMAVKGFCEAANTADISLLSEASRALLDRNNDTAAPFDAIPVHALFERQVRARPDRLAAADCERRLSFDELNRLANRLAHGLLKHGVQCSDIVGMLLDRSVFIVAAELGILKAGGAFLGLLPNYPDDRIDFCLRDGGSRLVLTTEELLRSRQALFSEGKPYRALTIEALLGEGEETDPGLSIRESDVAYCIYTSGTTGRPKGLMITHGNLACCAQQERSTACQCYGSRAGSVSLAMSSISFDMSLFEGLVYLLNGKSVVIATEREIHDPAALARLMTEHQVDVMTATPSFYTNYIDIPEFSRTLRAMKTIMVGAEAFPPKLYQALHALAPEATILNGYGPSECTICCSMKVIESGDAISLGRPISNVAFYTMDGFGHILPPYACGELIICGATVGPGYIGLPEKTAASFFRLNGAPAYHSGDLARIDSRGEAQYLGRMDDQVKLRGFRIELGEIEKCICAFEGIKQGAVVVRNNGKEDYLAGFFTGTAPVDITALMAHMRSTLTYYMVPDVLTQLDAMPMTASGKIDKKALPEIRREKKKRSERKPKRSLEAELCDLFGETLSVEEYYPEDNFFETGGTSLSASRVIMQLIARGFRVEYQDIFDHPTPEALAEYIDSTRTPATQASAVKASRGDFAPQLAHNTLACAPEVRRAPLGDVLLTGATGFLGIHVLRELLDRDEGRIICLVRSEDGFSAKDRLKNLLMYYFGEPFDRAFEDRIAVIDGDIIFDTLPEILNPIHFDTIINCAAIVKHYSADEMIRRVNVHGVENLILCAKAHSARLIQISTVSIPGAHTEETYQQQLRMHEDELFMIDSMNNKYVLSKYHAEEKVLEAIRDGLDAKIMRVGNLMGRYSDGEFQINSRSNAFLSALRGFATIGMCPISHATDPIRLSPIDLTAQAIVLLAGTGPQFTAFNVDNRYGFDEMQLIHACNHCGITIKPVDDEVYYNEYLRLLGDDRVNARLSGLITNDRPDLHLIETDNTFTANVLYRLGFSWPLMGVDYLARLINSLISLDFFEA